MYFTSTGFYRKKKKLPGLAFCGQNWYQSRACILLLYICGVHLACVLCMICGENKSKQKLDQPVLKTISARPLPDNDRVRIGEI